MALLGPDPDPGWPFRLDPFINIIRHAGRYLALPEGAPPYHVSQDLETLGRYDFGGALPEGICAHPKVDPITGEMIVFRYGFEEPFLSWATVDSSGAVGRGPFTVEGVNKTFMIHDCAVTERFLVLVVAPAVFDLNAMMSGGAVLGWQPELGTRIAVIPRDGSGPTRWLETDAFFVWHFANAYEDGGDVLLDFPWWSDFSMGPGSTASRAGAFVRARLALDAGKAVLDHLDELPGEFPRIDDRLTGRPHRYLTLARKSGRRPGLVVGEFDQLTQFDMRSGTARHAVTDLSLGEVVFAPRDGGREELDGYYLTYATALGDADHSYLVVWDAAGFPSEPVAKVRIPQRIPAGLHGNWLPVE
jgi:carotenoid cleavage dioxygenase